MRHNYLASQLILIWLFVLFCGGLYLRFQRPSAEESEPVPIIQLAERLAVVSKYGKDVPDAARRQLLDFALDLESDEGAISLIKGELPAPAELQSLSPTYQLMASELREPEPESQASLEKIAEEGVYRFTLTFALLCCLLLTALLSFCFPKVEDRKPQNPTELGSTGILGVFFGWDVFGFFGLAVMVSFLSTILDRFSLILLTQCCLYAFLLLILSQAKLRPGLQPFRKFSGSWVGKGYLLALCSVFLVNYLVTLMVGVSPQSENPVLQLFVDAPVWKLGTLGLLVVVIGPFFEEILFRGWLFGGLRGKWGDTWALVVSSMLFALIHGDAPALPALFVLGLIFGWVYQKSGSLWACFLVHSLWNATTFSLLISVMP